MSSNSTRKSLLIILSVLSIVVSGTFLISIFARGYRLDTDNGFKLRATGLLSATSKPKSARVYINDILTTATDDTINLPPGEYQIKITKDTYLPWTKKIKIEPELVYQTDTQLFRAAPNLKSLTNTDIYHPSINSDASKIVFAIASASATQKSGLYLFEPSEYLLQLSDSSPKLVATSTLLQDWTKFTYQFSPNSKELLASSANGKINYLLPLDQTITSKNFIDITPKLIEIKARWLIEQSQITKNKLEKLPLEIISYISTTSAVLSLSGDENKVLYQASKSGSLATILPSPPPTQSTQTQSRELIKDFYYVYDQKEDTNFLIGDTSLSSLNWLPSSNYLFYIKEENIYVIESDATNKLSLYSASNSLKSILPSSEGNKLILPLDKLYSLTIKDNR